MKAQRQKGRGISWTFALAAILLACLGGFPGTAYPDPEWDIEYEIEYDSGGLTGSAGRFIDHSECVGTSCYSNPFSMCVLIIGQTNGTWFMACRRGS